MVQSATRLLPIAGERLRLSARGALGRVLDIEIKGISMPLTRDKIVGHDRERLAFTFLMLNGNEPI